MFMIVLTVLEAVAHYKSRALNCAPIAIGMCFVICILAFGPVSSGSFNPARSIGPAIVAGKAKHLWIYIIAPILGALFRHRDSLHVFVSQGAV
jgi:aquaporin NIP